MITAFGRRVSGASIGRDPSGKQILLALIFTAGTLLMGKLRLRHFVLLLKSTQHGARGCCGIMSCEAAQ